MNTSAVTQPVRLPIYLGTRSNGYMIVSRQGSKVTRGKTFLLEGQTDIRLAARAIAWRKRTAA